jgi:hypothetical protein
VTLSKSFNSKYFGLQGSSNTITDSISLLRYCTRICGNGDYEKLYQRRFPTGCHQETLWKADTL